MPVARGLVLPVGSCIEAIGRAEVIARRSGLAAARLALSAEVVPESVTRSAEAMFGAELLVARSSSPLEADGGWSGAFSSYVAITSAELPVAVRGCWASMFGRDASERLEALGLAAVEAGMAVLIQACISPEPGGVAVVNGPSVAVTVAEKTLAGMLQGWDRGLHSVVEDSGPPRGPAVDQFGAGLLREVARIALECSAATGDDHFEWARAEGEVLILQCRRVGRAPIQPRGYRGDGELASVTTARVGRLISRYGGASGEALVLPWALAGGGAAPPVAPPGRPMGLVSIELLMDRATRLAAAAWGSDGPTAMMRTEQTLSALRTRRDPAALSRLAGLHHIEWSEGQGLLEPVEWLGSELVARGVLADLTDVWRLSLSQLEGYLDDQVVVAPGKGRLIPPGPWEPFLLECISANGTSVEAEPASEGSGAGRLFCLDVPRRLPRSLQRHVLYLPRPLAGFAPLLWGAAGLVVATGSASAHLFDVARSLGVPAVAGCEIAEWKGAHDLTVAVDGTGGVVAWL
ncbi:MAG: PEP/pyruvate-binding domain-containing protein [Acidimicrobiales bacterium]